MKATNSYNEGCVFTVPLRSGGIGRGVVARSNHKGLVCGYFFGPKLENASEIVDLGLLDYTQAVMAGIFGDLGFLKEEWQVIGQIVDWRGEDWPLPTFFSRSDGVLNLTTYDEKTLKPLFVESKDATLVDTSQMAEDGVMGYGFVEIRLTSILG